MKKKIKDNAAIANDLSKSPAERTQARTALDEAVEALTQDGVLLGQQAELLAKDIEAKQAEAKKRRKAAKMVKDYTALSRDAEP